MICQHVSLLSSQDLITACQWTAICVSTPGEAYRGAHSSAPSLCCWDDGQNRTRKLLMLPMLVFRLLPSMYVVQVSVRRHGQADVSRHDTALWV